MRLRGNNDEPLGKYLQGYHDEKIKKPVFKNAVGLPSWDLIQLQGGWLCEQSCLRIETDHYFFDAGGNFEIVCK